MYIQMEKILDKVDTKSPLGHFFEWMDLIFRSDLT